MTAREWEQQKADFMREWERLYEREPEAAVRFIEHMGRQRRRIEAGEALTPAQLGAESLAWLAEHLDPSTEAVTINQLIRSPATPEGLT